MQNELHPMLAVAIVVATAAATALLIKVLHPLLVRYALARPNARSSHSIPTPQGGGIPIVIMIAVMIAGCVLADVPGFDEPWSYSLLFTLAALAVAGAIDDISPLPVLPRLGLQFAIAILLIVTLPVSAPIIPVLPSWLEKAGLVLGLVWFTNLTNFMDGIDWMTVVEVVPVTACLILLAMWDTAPDLTDLLPVLLALLGGLLGFAPFNRHVARLFLGDVGSLPIGALLGWLLIVLAMSGFAVAALILPLYYLADATITLARRFRNGERISQAHRSHFYQRAVKGGFSVPEVTRDVFVLNCVLAVLATLSTMTSRPTRLAALLVIAIIATGYVLRRFERGRGI